MEYQQEEDPFLFFQVDQFQAIFPDGSTWGNTVGNSVEELESSPNNHIRYSLSVQTGTPLGTELWISEADAVGEPTNESMARTLRLIFIAPSMDWRKAANYDWKLDSAWISNPKSEQDNEEYDWWHWNVQSFVDSAIQVPKSDDDPWRWDCDRVELPFHPLLEDNRGWSTRSPSDSQLILSGVRIGFGRNISTTSDVFSPCAGLDSCAVVDGEVVATSKLESLWNSATFSSTTIEPASLRMEFLGLGVLIVTMLVGFVAWCKRRQRFMDYQRLHPTPETDLTLHEEDSYVPTLPRSTLEGAVNETG